MSQVEFCDVCVTWTIPFNGQWWEDDLKKYKGPTTQAHEELKSFLNGYDGVKFKGVDVGWEHWIVRAIIDLSHLTPEFLEDICQDLNRKAYP